MEWVGGGGGGEHGTLTLDPCMSIARRALE